MALVCEWLSRDRVVALFLWCVVSCVVLGARAETFQVESGIKAELAPVVFAKNIGVCDGTVNIKPGSVPYGFDFCVCECWSRGVTSAPWSQSKRIHGILFAYRVCIWNLAQPRRSTDPSMSPKRWGMPRILESDLKVGSSGRFVGYRLRRNDPSPLIQSYLLMSEFYGFLRLLQCPKLCSSLVSHLPHSSIEVPVGEFKGLGSNLDRPPSGVIGSSHLAQLQLGYSGINDRSYERAPSANGKQFLEGIVLVVISLRSVFSVSGTCNSTASGDGSGTCLFCLVASVEAPMASV